MRIGEHTYEYGTIVVGGGLNAKVYAYYHQCPCIYRSPSPPFRFDMLQSGLVRQLQGQRSKNALQTWEEISFVLGTSGHLPVGNSAQSLNVRDNTLRITTLNSRLIKFRFDKLIVFDDREIYGLPAIKESKIGKSRILDWFNVRSGMEHQHDSLKTDDDFVKEVIFYPSDRFGNQSSGRVRKDLVSISYLDEVQVGDFEYSDTMARFKILKLMKDAGIKGARNGRDTYNPNLYRYYSPKIETTQREIFPDVKNYYEDDPRFEFRYDTPEEIIKEFDKEPDSYASKLINLLTKTN